jgi:tetratricopeptide (TPR) repeat protein
LPRNLLQGHVTRERAPGARSLFLFLLVLALQLACAGGGIPRGGGGATAVAPDADSLVAEGRAASESGDYARAKRKCDAALEVDPDNAAAYRGLARIAVATGDPTSAVHYYEKLLDQPGVTAADYAGFARVLVSSGHDDQALALLANAEIAHPDDARLQGDLGAILLERGRIDEAIGHLRRAVDLGGGQTVHRQLGRGLLRAGRYDEAVEVLLSYDEHYPGDFDVNMEIAYECFERGDYGSALPFYRAATAANPKSIDARVGLAKTLEQLGRIDSAIRVYDEAIEIRGLTRAMEPVILAQANLLIKRQKYERALQLAERAAENFPATAGLECARGMALAGEGRYDEALDAFFEATGDPRWSEFANAQIRRLRSIRRGR